MGEARRRDPEAPQRGNPPPTSGKRRVLRMLATRMNGVEYRVSLASRNTQVYRVEHRGKAHVLVRVKDSLIKRSVLMHVQVEQKEKGLAALLPGATPR